MTKGTGTQNQDLYPYFKVPMHSLREFKERQTRYCICVFVINEGARIREQLSRMAAYADKIDIIVGDGGSSDGSLDAVYLREMRVSVLLSKCGPGRLGAQMRMALAYAVRRGYEGAIVVDGNGKDDLAAIPRFIEALDNGYDHVQGSRYVKGGKGVNTPWLRHWAVLLLHAPLISVAARTRYTDTTNGFRAYSRRLLTDARVQPFRDCFVSYELHYYLAIRAGQLRFNVMEIPVTRAYPAGGDLPTKIKGLRGYGLVLCDLFRAVCGFCDPVEHRK